MRPNAAKMITALFAVCLSLDPLAATLRLDPSLPIQPGGERQSGAPISAPGSLKDKSGESASASDARLCVLPPAAQVVSRKPSVILQLNKRPNQAAANDRSRPVSELDDAEPLFRFGVIADVQYADKLAQGSRRYRDALERLRQAVKGLNEHHLAFVANLGDLIDGNGTRSHSDLDIVLRALSKSKAPLRHVVGNHCLEVGRPALMKALRLAAPYYDFSVATWRFVVLDGMDVSIASPVGSPEWSEARGYLRRNPLLLTYNGAIGARQRQWLLQVLSVSRAADQRVVVLCHHPLLPAASDESNTLWNWEDVIRLIEASGCVDVVLGGHDHRGGYAVRNGIHHLVVPAIVESAPKAEPYLIIDVFLDRWVIRGPGIPRQLDLKP